MTAAFHSLCREAQGLALSHIWRGYGSALFLELGMLTPSTLLRRDGSRGNSYGQISVGIEGSWRIEDEHSIVCGSWFDEDEWSKGFQQILDARIVELGLSGRLPEIDLALTNGLHVVSFSTGADQPEWTVVDRRLIEPVWHFVRNGQVTTGDGGP